MNRVLFIADTHFGHKRIIEYEPLNRPFATIEEHDRELIALWNAAVNPNDTVWHLGDVFFGKDAHNILSELNGLKKLVLGNHDHYPLAIYESYFVKIASTAVYRNSILSHVPVHPCQLDKRYVRNIHGHLHGKRLDDPRYVCVSAERIGLAPIPLDRLINC